MMKYILILIVSFQLIISGAIYGNPFDPDRIKNFSTTYQMGAQQDGTNAQIIRSSPINGLIAVLIVDNISTQTEELYVAAVPPSITPPYRIDTAKGLVGTSGKANSVKVNSLPDANKYISNAPLGKILFLPPQVSGRLYFSLSNATQTEGLQFGSVAPNFSNPTDANYEVVFDKCEYTYTQGENPVISCNATSVDFFSIPINLQLLDGSKEFANISHSSGLTQKREAVMDNIMKKFQSAGKSSEWQKLYIHSGEKDPNKIIRVLSPNKSMVPPKPSFDPNYLQNQDGGFNYIEAIWSGAKRFYQNGHKLHIQMPIGAGDSPADGSRVYEADFQSDGTIHFSQVLPTGESDILVLSKPAHSPGPLINPYESTTYKIFAALPLYTPNDMDNLKHPGDVQQLSQLFSEGIICGMLPRDIPDPHLPLRTIPPGQAGNMHVNGANGGNQNDSPTDENQQNNLASTYEHINSFFKFNSKLDTKAETGPWYDLYGEAIHNVSGPATGLSYTYGFDEGMYPQVLINNQPVTASTLLRITVGGTTEQ